MASPWQDRESWSVEAMADYLQAGSSHSRRTQERAQSLLDTATSVTGTSRQFNRECVTKDLNSIMTHNAYKLRLDALRFFFQVVPPNVLCRLKRPRNLLLWLCDIATYVPSVGMDGVEATDVPTLVNRAHPFRGKALSVLVLLLRHLKSIQATATPDTDNSTRETANQEDGDTDVCQAAAAAVVALHIAKPSFFDPNASSFMIGSVIAHQVADVLEQCWYAVRGDTDDEIGSASPPDVLSVTCAVDSIFAGCAPFLCHLLSELQGVAASNTEKPSGSSQMFDRVQVDLSKVLAMFGGAVTALKGQGFNAFDSGATLHDSIRSYVSPGTAALIKAKQGKYLPHDVIFTAAHSIIKTSCTSGVVHDSYSSAFHSAIMTVETLQINEEEKRSRLIELEAAVLTKVEEGSVGSISGPPASAALELRRLESLIGMLGSVWEAIASISSTSSSSTPQHKPSPRDVLRVGRVVDTLMQMLGVQRKALKLYGRKADGKLDSDSGVTSAMRAEMRDACVDCRCGCISVLPILFSSPEGKFWIFENSQLYWHFTIDVTAAPTLLVSGYSAFKSFAASSDTEEDDGEMEEKRTFAQKEASKVIFHLCDALQVTDKYTHKAAMDLLQAIELLATAGCEELFAFIPGMWEGKEGEGEEGEEGGEGESIAQVASALVYAHVATPVVSAKRKETTNNEEEPPLLLWRRSSLAAWEAAIQHSKLQNTESSWKVVRKPFSFLLKLLSYELVLLMTFTNYEGSETIPSIESKNLKKHFRMRYGTTEVELLQQVLTQTANVFMALMAELSGTWENEKFGTWQTRWGSCGVESELGDASNSALEIGQVIENLQELYEVDHFIDMLQAEILVNTAWKVVPEVLRAVASASGRQLVYEGDAFQQCLELDIARSCVRTLAQMSSYPLSSATSDIWALCMSETVTAAVEGGRLQKSSGFLKEISEATESSAAALARTKLQKHYASIQPIYNYARELLLEVADCVIWKWGLSGNGQDSSGSVDSSAGATLIQKVESSLPARLDASGAEQPPSGDAVRRIFLGC